MSDNIFERQRAAMRERREAMKRQVIESTLREFALAYMSSEERSEEKRATSEAK